MQRVLDWLDNIFSEDGASPLPQKQKWILFGITTAILMWIIITIIIEIAGTLKF